MMQYISSITVYTNSSGQGKKSGLFSSPTIAVRRVCKNVPSEFQQYKVIPGMKVDFTMHEISSLLNAILLPKGLR